MPVFLLDTCAVIWIANGDPIREPAAGTLQEACGPGAGFLVSSMTAWEIAMLEAKGRMALSISPEIWFDRFCALPGVVLAEMPPAVLVASCNLPGSPPADPVDRILIATARAIGCTLVTRDRHLLDYGGHGMCGSRHVEAWARIGGSALISARQRTLESRSRLEPGEDFRSARGPKPRRQEICRHRICGR
ncbi:MAG: type II toxin-antitoxin system VapC family toxin [Alphaproteobacteria bacterium]|nr:type II toxin-antitoxin system VapC family toxin [Alphaproteobacteria bacterium]